MGTPGGTYAPYALCPANTVFHIPKNVSFEEAATIPLTAGTAAAGLYEREGGLGLPLPFLPATDPLPLVIYGASGSVGSFALQLASKSNIHPLICIAGGGGAAVQSLLDRSKGDTIIDYRKGDEQVVKEIKAALDGVPLRYALDTVAHKNTSRVISEAMTHGGQIARTLPLEGGLSNDVEQFQLSVSTVQADQKDFGFVIYQLFGLGLRDGWLKPRPYEVKPGGLYAVEGALASLKAGKSTKYVFRIEETEGL
jgi:NADPH:quinone reductase-like Zn-dependent oxidoreductase